MSEPTRVYERDGLALEWHDKLCEHGGECLRGLPTVFDLAKRPWVNIDGATPDEIRAQVAKCPSGALKIRGT